MNAGNFWRPPAGVLAALSRGERKFNEYRRRLLEQAAAERRADLERRKVAA